MAGPPPLPLAKTPPAPLPGSMPSRYDDMAVAEAGGKIRIDVYGDVFENRVVAMIDKKAAFDLSYQLASIASRL